MAVRFLCCIKSREAPFCVASSDGISSLTDKLEQCTYSVYKTPFYAIIMNIINFLLYEKTVSDRE